MVTGKLRPWASPITESLSPQERERVIDALIPPEEGIGPRAPRQFVDAEVPEVSLEEIARARKRLGNNKAPGPDGIPGNAWAQALEVLSPYLRQLFTRQYFRDRWLVYTCRSGEEIIRSQSRGVPQESVVGPTVWDIAFDKILRAPLPPRCQCFAYADDVLLVAWGPGWGDAVRTAEDGVACVARAVRALGLEMAPHKSEAVFFHDGLRGAPPPAQVIVGNVPIPVGPKIKYLGLTLDGQWSFEDHFVELAPKLERGAAAISRLIPNLGGPQVMARRLYAGAVRSVALYGATRRAKLVVRRFERRVATRVARLYRTVSHRVATALAGLAPIALLAPAYAYAYERARRATDQGVRLTARAKEVLGRQARQMALQAWQRQLSDPNDTSGRRRAEAIHPCLAKWLDRGWGGVTFRMDQVLTGHGCFGEYLCRIGRDLGPPCHHCGADQDTAQHTLEHCPAWADERRVLVHHIGRDLSLLAVMSSITESERSWREFASGNPSVPEDCGAAGEGGESQRVADSPVLRVRGRRLETPPRSPSTSEAGLRTETTPQKGGGPPAEREDPLVAMEARIMASMGTMVSRIVAGAVAPLVRRGAREGAEPTHQAGQEEPGNGGTAKKKKKEQRPSSAVAGPAIRVPASEEEQPWSTVVGRRAARPTAQPPAPAGKGKPVPGKPAPGRGASGGGKPATGKPSLPGGRPGAKGPKPPKSPKTAAVVITAADGDYKGAVEKAQKGVDIDALGIAAPRVRRALTGALIYEIPGPESATKADELASRLVKVFEGSGVRVTRPLKKAELRVRRLDDAATEESVSRAVAAAGGCDPRDVEVGPIQRSPDGLGTSWIRLPAQAGGKVADLGRIRVPGEGARASDVPQSRGPPRPVLQVWRGGSSGARMRR
ncbi:uncharacterized protein LOC113561603 [Ooceraea biroi]|uniref:uncharacterized protein LOC113561603 n=1 Tax=Ooceraea biroi TaxID=2015173 RepID=UPI000F07CE78|nr:uncharacterized protein LOC113561603 [Ooceraea biroi]